MFNNYISYNILKNNKECTKHYNKSRYKLHYHSSNKYINIQVLDGIGNTLIYLSTRNLCNIQIKNNIYASYIIGKKVGSILKLKKIKKIFFDRGKLKYHGKIQACHEGMRKVGLNF